VYSKFIHKDAVVNDKFVDPTTGNIISFKERQNVKEIPVLADST
jgi:hypothetical protein